MPVYRINAKKLRRVVEAPPDELITLYTFQHKDALKEGIAKGYLCGNKEFIDYNFMAEPYAWMVEQMAARLEGFSGDYPVWCHLGVVQPSFNKVRIKVKVPRKRLLLSHYNQWEDILNFYPVIETKEELDTLDPLFPIGGFSSIKDVPEAIKESWYKIFDLKYEKVENNDFYYDPTQVQVCVDRIYISDIIDVTVRYDVSDLNLLK